MTVMRQAFILALKFSVWFKEESAHEYFARITHALQFFQVIVKLLVSVAAGPPVFPAALPEFADKC